MIFFQFLQYCKKSLELVGQHTDGEKMESYAKCMSDIKKKIELSSTQLIKSFFRFKISFEFLIKGKGNMELESWESSFLGEYACQGQCINIMSE